MARGFSNHRRAITGQKSSKACGRTKQHFYFDRFSNVCERKNEKGIQAWDLTEIKEGDDQRPPPSILQSYAGRFSSSLEHDPGRWDHRSGESCDET
jgi:hypothetical protein